MHSVKIFLLQLKNAQTKIKLFHYLKQKNALYTSNGLVYNRSSLQVVPIY